MAWHSSWHVCLDRWESAFPMITPGLLELSFPSELKRTRNNISIIQQSNQIGHMCHNSRPAHQMLPCVVLASVNVVQCSTLNFIFYLILITQREIMVILLMISKDFKFKQEKEEEKNISSKSTKTLIPLQSKYLLIDYILSQQKSTCLLIFIFNTRHSIASKIL